MITCDICEKGKAKVFKSEEGKVIRMCIDCYKQRSARQYNYNGKIPSEHE
jgi:hypothetical protein